MSDAFTAPQKLLSGPRFMRADLHIHSFGPGGSTDVKDTAMTPRAIVEQAKALELDVIAITDHNRTGNVAAAVEAAKHHTILVVPGVELSSPGGHILVYAESLDKLERICGKLMFDDKREACQTSVTEILVAVAEFGGLAIAAHIERSTGIENAIAGYGDAKASAVRSSTLVALEITDMTAANWYSLTDTNEARRALLKSRLELLNNPFIRSFPKIQSSDAHSLATLGKNAADRKKLTRLKMANLSWEAFRAAFADPEARIRLEEQIPAMVPRFVGMSVTGGFLDGQAISFSSNLTCIIGGRGSGKSTAFRSSALHLAVQMHLVSDLQKLGRTALLSSTLTSKVRSMR